jgi:tetratricopeptide (TPR) repeat protein
MEARDVRGRGFNPFYMGGYMLWRFWPDKTRLPFMDIHQSGTRLERERYVNMFMRPNGWFQLQQQYAFDYVLLDAAQDPRLGDRSRDVLDSDTTFTLVFRDDAAALYVNRNGHLGTLAAREGYRYVPGGEGRLAMLGRACEADSSIRGATRAELERMLESSVLDSRARSMIANLDLIDGRFDDARAQLETALSIDPDMFAGHERLGIIAMQEERWEDAVRELELERAGTGGSPALSARLARAWQAVGNVEKSRKYYGEVFNMAPTDPALLDSIGRADAQ